MGQAAAARVPPSGAAPALWEQFCSRIVTSVQTYNCDARETVWTVRDTGGVLLVAGRPGGPRVRLRWDRTTGRLVCLFNPRDRWDLSFTPESLDQAVRDILDHLVRSALPAATGTAP